MIGVFCALDGMLFYVFFEATLIPMYLIIGIWGGPNKIYAAFKFFLYTLLGSLLMLVALIFLYTKSGGSFDILTWHKLPLSGTRRRCCSLRSLRRLRSRCRCGRCTPGCPMCTWRRPLAARPCWRPSC
jgi:NADH:ubiquinone oxidoreductase subunit 4 (subunit M)